MSTVSTQQFAPMNADYAQINQPSVQVNNPLEVSASADRVSQFLKDTSSAPIEHNVSVNKESLEKLFAMFEFAVKAMRSMLASMGVLPRLPAELGAQSRIAHGPDPKVVADAVAKPVIKLHTPAKTHLKPGPEVKVMPDGPAHVTIGADGNHTTLATTTPLAEAAQYNKQSSDINVTVQVQNCPCPHTGEQVAPQPGLTPWANRQPVSPARATPNVDALPSSPAVVIPVVERHSSPASTRLPKLDTSPSQQTQAMPMTVSAPQPNPLVKPDVPTSTTVDPKPETRTTPDLTAPAPDDLVGTSSGHFRNRFNDHFASRPSLRQRF